MRKLLSKVKLALLRLAGYGYFILLFAIALGLIFTCVFLILQFIREGRLPIRRTSRVIIGVMVPLFALLGALIKGLASAISFKVHEPNGIDTNKEEFPELYKMLEEIRARLKCPTIHSVKFNLSFNASVREIPRFWVCGPYRRHLVIGVPLMLALSADELRAVIAHELGHLSKSHGRISLKAFRAEKVWQEAFEELIESSKGMDWMVKPFIVRYIPALNNALLSLKRELEFAADRCSAAATDKATAAATLLKFPIYNNRLDDVFWPDIYKLAKTEERPPLRLFHMMEKFMAEPPAKEQAEKILDRELRMRSLPCWTHPSLSERLMNIGAGYEHLPKHREKSALRVVLGDRADAVLNKATDLWLSGVYGNWNRIYKTSEESRQKLQELEEMKNAGKLTRESGIKRALLLEELESTERALEAFRELYEEYPNNPQVVCHLGRLLIKSGDPEGQAFLERAMKLDAQLIPLCCSVLYVYHRGAGRIDEAKRYYHFAVDFMKTNALVKAERDHVTLKGAYRSHDLDMDAVEKLRERLLEKRYVKRAYVAIKAVEHSGQFPLYVILVKTRGLFSSKKAGELAGSGLLPWEYFVVPISGKNRELEYRFINLNNSRIV